MKRISTAITRLIDQKKLKKKYRLMSQYSDPKSFVNFLLPPLTKGRAGVG